MSYEINLGKVTGTGGEGSSKVMTGATANAPGTSGDVPAPAAGSQDKFLRGDGTWSIPPDTTYTDFVKSGSGAKAGLVPAPSTTAGNTKYLREDGTWSIPPDTKYEHPTTSGNKHIPSGGSSGQILKWSADGTAKWDDESSIGSNINLDIFTNTTNSIGIGINSVSNHIYYSTALGYNAISTGARSVALGCSSNSGGTDSIAIGTGTKSHGLESIAIGSSTNTNGTYSIVMGADARAFAGNSIAIGYNANGSVNGAIAIGHVANVIGRQGTAIGYSSGVAGNSSTAVGRGAVTYGNDSISLGCACMTNGSNSISAGSTASAKGNYSVAIGYAINVYGISSIAMGNFVQVNGNNAIAIGTSANIGSNYSIAIGYNAQVATTNANTIQLGDTGTSRLLCKVALTTTSDIRDKTDIEEIDDKSLEFLNRIKAIRYVSNQRIDYIDHDNLTEEDQNNLNTYGICEYDREAHINGTKKGSRIRVGISAQEVQKALEEVFGDSSYANLVDDNLYDIEDKDSIPKCIESQLTVNYSGFIPFLIKAIQELTVQNKMQQIEINDLKDILSNVL